MSTTEFLLQVWTTRPNHGPFSKSLGDNIYVWLAIFLATIAIFKQAYDAISRRKKTRDDVEEALDKQPLVREQLELGNWGEAIKQLNIIINSQADHIKRQDRELVTARGRIDHLESRNEALESESETSEQRHDGLKVQYDELEVKYDDLQAEVIRLQLLLGEYPSNQGE